jgi:hypothetical protein
MVLRIHPDPLLYFLTEMLNFDCLLNIFKFLFLSDSQRCSRVSKDWLSVFYAHLRLNQSDELIIQWRHIHNILLCEFRDCIVDHRFLDLVDNGFLTNLGLTIFLDRVVSNRLFLVDFWGICILVSFDDLILTTDHFYYCLRIPLFSETDSFLIDSLNGTRLLVDCSQIIHYKYPTVKLLTDIEYKVFEKLLFEDIKVYNNHWTPLYENIMIGGKKRFVITKKDENRNIIWKKSLIDLQPFIGFTVKPTTWYVLIEWIFVLFKLSSNLFWLINAENPNQSGILDFSHISAKITFKRFDKDIGSIYKGGNLFLFDSKFHVMFECYWHQSLWKVKNIFNKHFC